MQKIAIHSVPRSGSTWLGEILNSSPVVKYCYQPLYSYRFKDFLNHNSSKKSIDRFFSLLSTTTDEYICQTSQREAGTLPIEKKSDLISHVIYKETHHHHIIENLLRKDETTKFILLVRDPIEVMNSWINAPKEFDPSWDVKTQLLSGELKNLGKKENFFGLDAWVQTTTIFEHLAKEYPKRVLLLKYSVLKRSSLQTAESIFEFCGLKLTESTSSFLRESSEKQVSDTYSVFRGGKMSRISLDDNLVKTITTYVNDAGLSRYINAEIDE